VSICPSVRQPDGQSVILLACQADRMSVSKSVCQL